MEDSAAPGSSSENPSLDAALKRAEAYLEASRAANTRRGYESDFRLFRDWCRRAGVSALPASEDTLMAFLASEADRGASPKTLARRRAAIAYYHENAGHASPAAGRRIRELLSGIRRKSPPRTRRKDPLTTDLLEAILAPLGNSLADCRDRAMLLLGFAAALRRSEIVAIDRSDITFGRRGLTLRIPRSKGDQEGEGQWVAVVRGKRHCPIKALRAWLDRAGITEGLVFRRLERGGRVGRRGLTPAAVAKIVKKRAQDAGFDPKAFAGHSLRSGFLTSAADAGKSVWKMRATSRHRSLESLAPYIREMDAWKDNAGEDLL